MDSLRKINLVFLICCCTTVCTVALAESPISFNSQIRPILSENCFACHGPEKANRASGLRLDQREPAVDYGALVAGEPDDSLMIMRVFDDDTDTIMPPPGSHKSLTMQQKELLSEWVRQGGKYEKHWSFEPLPTQIPVPQVGKEWNCTSVDAFVTQAFQEKGFAPNVEADKASWLRRVSFDLTGLPPTLEELDNFHADRSSEAYELVVDRLLESPSYAERMAVMWLDVARYADTFGYQSDIAMEVWPWRQWVIEAFDKNMPYDQFLTEQIAGDMIPNATDSQRLATAFNRLHRQTNEGGSVAEEFRLTGITDRTTTASTAFLGLTMECCRCHDHKFDPIKQREFYALSAYFSDIDEFGLYSHFNFAAPTPAMLLYTGDQQQQHNDALLKISQAEAMLTEQVTAATKLLQADPNELEQQLPLPPEPTFAASLDGTIEGVIGLATICDGDEAIKFEDAPRFGRTSAFSYSLWVRPQTNGPRMVLLHQSRAAEDAAFRGLELTLDNGYPQFSMIHFWPGNAMRVRAADEIPEGAWTHLAVTHDGSGRADGVKLFVDGNAIETETIRDKLTRDVRQRAEWGDLDVEKVALTLGARFRDSGFRGGGIDEFKVFDWQLSSAQVAAIYAAVRPNEIGADISFEMAVEHQLLCEDESVAQARLLLMEARRVEDELITGVRQIMTMRHYENAPPSHILGRGEYTNKLGVVSPAVPELNGDLPSAGQDRLALAKWMTDSRNPLTSRVIANRMWHLFFGRGIVVTLEDFGSQGTPPSHPELLDYLSCSLMDHDWDLHWLCREIVLSATYRQSSKFDDPKLYQNDPDNKWLTRGPKQRLSAEQLRDTVLSTSGLLVEKLGGPSVMPYQPAGLWEESGTGKTYEQSTGEGLYRRSLYTFWKRTSPPPTMLTLDATSRETCTPRRELTTTPLQALVFLNDPQYVEASRVLAGNLIRNHAGNLDERWNELSRRLISRNPNKDELVVLNELYADQKEYFVQAPTETQAFLAVGIETVDSRLDSIDVAATTIVVQAMFAYDETITLR